MAIFPTSVASRPTCYASACTARRAPPVWLESRISSFSCLLTVAGLVRGVSASA
jgi:hypothetical protein